jgi:hypothetical protein
LLKIIFTNHVERVAGYLKGLFLYRMKYAFYRVACTMGMPITHSFLKKRAESEMPGGIMKDISN